SGTAAGAAATAATAAVPAPVAVVWKAAIGEIPYVIKLAGVSGTVQSSLFGAVEEAGEQDQLAIELADIFGWDLDFYTDTRQGDVFRVLVEKKYLDGKFAGYGQVVAAEYVNAGQPYDALRFHDELGLLAYYRPDGRPMKREFLRSPLKFAARITSGFSRERYHPILKVYRPHLGTDFAAPTGTPVQTIGNGVVTRAGRYGGDGNMVQIRHPGGYQTLYLHLSRILVRVGQRVAQGQRIGLVGMTGLATGPHLDFRIEQGGEFENFERLRKRLPPADPVAADLMEQFRALRELYLPELAKLQPASAATAAGADPPPGH
ncbi:MAG: peptidoglycan DD-metalloendopeptidase family protein, partial [Terriglobales bacterium]